MSGGREQRDDLGTWLSATTVTGDCDRCPSGAYLIDATQREQVLRLSVLPPEFAVAVLDGAAAGTRAGFFQELARALRFPGYFGHNWDAVYDCLTDLNWLPATGYVLLLDGLDHLAMNEPGQWGIGLKVLRESCEFWRPLSRPMYALLYGSGNWLPACHRFPPGVSPPGATPDESEVGGRLSAIGCWLLLSHDSRLAFTSSGSGVG